MRVEAFLRSSSRRSPGKVAVVAGDREYTYAELDRQSDALARTLAAGGVRRGDRVIVFMDNCWEAIVAIFATLKVGAAFSPVNPSTKADKLAFMIANCRPSALVTLGTLLTVTLRALEGPSSVGLVIATGRVGEPKLSQRLVSFDDAVGESAGAAPIPFPGIELDLAMLIYTSGSTGMPKGVMMTHQNINAAATSITTYLGSVPDDIILNVLPISFDYGLYQILMAVKVGATLVLEKSFAFPRAILARAEKVGATGLPLVPTMAALLLQMKDLTPGMLPKLRYITNTAAALPPAHIMRLRDLFPQAQLFSMYGLTECKRCTYLPPHELDRRPGSVGIAIPGTEAWIVDDTGNRVGRETVGELVIRGPHVMKGYWENETATALVLRPGPFPWEKVLYTGDLFRMDKDGFLYFVARKDDIIKSRGEKISPKEVETVLYALPGVREAAIIGVPDSILGASLKAIIALEPGASLTRNEVLKHCAAHLEDFMVPKSVEIRQELPKSDNGKIDRRAIAAELQAQS